MKVGIDEVVVGHGRRGWATKEAKLAVQRERLHVLHAASRAESAQPYGAAYEPFPKRSSRKGAVEAVVRQASYVCPLSQR
jgi:hypothetical protein